MDEKNTQAKKAEVRPNLRFNRDEDEAYKIVEEEDDLSLSTIHMIGGPNYPDLENRIWGEI